MTAGPRDAPGAEPARAEAYGLLARLLARPPEADLLAALGRLRGDATPWGSALGALAAAANARPEAVEREFNRLFIGVDRGELAPYASFYRTGFLHDRPLVDLRSEMAALGIARSPGVAEPEDHIAGVLDIMAGLIDGRFGGPPALDRQRGFFARHLAPWAARFFDDLEHADAARFYRPVGAAGKLLITVEQNAFDMVA